MCVCICVCDACMCVHMSLEALGVMPQVLSTFFFKEIGSRTALQVGLAGQETSEMPSLAPQCRRAREHGDRPFFLKYSFWGLNAIGSFIFECRHLASEFPDPLIR